MTEVRDKMREHRQQWFSHVMRQSEESLVRTILGLEVEVRWGRDRLEGRRESEGVVPPSLST